MGHKGPWQLGGSPLEMKSDRIDGGSRGVYIYMYVCMCVCIYTCYDLYCP